MQTITLEIISTIVVTIIGIVVPLAFAEFRRRTGVAVDEFRQRSIQLAFENAAKNLIQRYGVEAVTQPGFTPIAQQRTEIIDYVHQAAPEAVKYYDLGSRPSTIVDKVLPHVISIAIGLIAKK